MTDHFRDALKREVHHLAGRLVENDISAEELDRLQELVVSDSAARKIYVQYVYDGLNLHAWAPGVESTPAVVIDSGEQPTLMRAPSPQHSYFTRRRIAISLVIATLVLIVGITPFGFITWPFSNRPIAQPAPQPNDPGIVAAVTGVHEPTWGEGGVDGTLGRSLMGGDRLVLKSGMAEITFAGGAVVRLVGPADFRANRRGAGTLKFGQLSADVNRQARGFVVDTPTARVIDLGTQFGLAVDEAGDTIAEVITGKVDLHRIHRDDGSLGTAMRLRAGSAAQVTAHGKGIATHEPTNQFVRALPGATVARFSTGDEEVVVLDSGIRKIMSHSPLLTRDFILSGGRLQPDGGSVEMHVRGVMTLESGTITYRGQKTGTFAVTASSYAGSGTIAIEDNRNSLVRFNGGDFSGFTGTFRVRNGGAGKRENLSQNRLGFAFDITTPSFGIELLEDKYDLVTPETAYGAFQYFDGVDVMVTSLTIGGDAIPAGTYTFATLSDLSDGSYAPFLADEGGGTGTITVEPRAMVGSTGTEIEQEGGQ